MKRVKACFNCNCKEYKKTYFKESDESCPECGEKLNYVCKHPKCFKQLPDDFDDTYCPIHRAERKDKWEEFRTNICKIGVGIFGVAGLARLIYKCVDEFKKKK